MKENSRVKYIHIMNFNVNIYSANLIFNQKFQKLSCIGSFILQVCLYLLRILQ